jgi:hypothetical protein
MPRNWDPVLIGVFEGVSIRSFTCTLQRYDSRANEPLVPQAARWICFPAPDRRSSIPEAREAYGLHVPVNKRRAV